MTESDEAVIVYDRGRFERVLRMIREAAAIVALLLASAVMFLLLSLAGAVLQRVHAGTGPDPAPVVSECPFGDGEC